MLVGRSMCRRVVQDRMAGVGLHRGGGNAVEPVRRGGHGQEQESQQGNDEAHQETFTDQP